MNVNQMRVALEKKYGKPFVDGKKDDQILAIYRRLQSQNKI
jgi:hypothetical protein